MPFEKIGDEMLSGRVNLRLLVAEKAQLQEDADLAGIGMSELIRRRYFGRPIVADVNMVMIKELRRIGGLLKHVHNESRGVYSLETAKCIQALNAAITRLVRDH